MWGTWVLILLATTVTAITAWGITDKHWRAEVVKRGFARWTVVDNSGRTEFEWIK